MNKRITCFASVISEIQQSDIYLTVKARLFETPGANLNGVRVTPAFLSEIVNNQEKYVGLPLCADVKALANGNYQHLGHLYDARTGEFHSAQIGSFYQFEEEPTADGAALIGYARIMKRNKAVCRAISELFADGALKFSFEISCGSYRELDDGTLEIDASSENFLEGAAIVSFPACERAVALDLVAELTDDGGDNMTDVNETSVVAEEAEVASTEQTVETAETKEETAEVVVTEHHCESTSVEVYDTETGTYTEETVTHEIHTNSPAYAEEQVAEEATAENKTAPEEVHVAEDQEEKEDDPSDEEEPDDETAACGKKKECSSAEEQSTETAEENAVDQFAQIVAELKSEIAALRSELAELKAEPAKVIAEAVQNTISEVNPFVENMTSENKKYKLLECDEKLSSYTLLDRA